MKLRFVLLISSVAAMGGFLFGYDSGCINGTVNALEEAFGASGIASGFNVASMLLGCAAGAFFAGRIADMFGRRSTLFAAAVAFALSAWGSGIADSSLEFIIYRLVGGFAVGAASVISPAYISEIAPAEYRGRLTSLQQLAIVLGLFMAFLVNYLIVQAAGSAEAVFWLGYPAWRWMFWAELAPIAVFAVGLVFIPESPRYLVSAGKAAVAGKIFERIAPAGQVPQMVREIQASLDATRRPGFRDLVDSATRRIHPIVWVGIAIAVFQQLVGINVIFYYGEVLWRAAGFSEADALKINVIGGALNIFSTVVAILLVDKWGRKPLLIAGSVVMTVTLGAMAAIFSTAKMEGGALQLEGLAGIAALVAANLYIVGFATSWGPVVWVLLGEMFPNQMRGAALAVAGLAMWGANFAITMTFPPLLHSVGLGGAYGLYAAFAFVSLFVVKLLVRETKGRTLESMSADALDSTND